MKIEIQSPVAILGYGVEGKAAETFLKSQGVEDVTVLDQAQDMNAFDDLTPYKTIVRSPGVKFHQDGIELAIDMGANVTSNTKWTLEAARDRMTCITGSNGKTTTTAMTRVILEEVYGEKLIAGGNDGEPVLMRALEDEKAPILMEVSSFQFQDVDQSPHIAAVMNITPNHLDWHDNMEEYRAAKENLLRFQKSDDWALLNANNEDSAKLEGSSPAQKFWVGAEKGEHWASWRDEELWLRHGDETIKVVEKWELKVKTHPDNLLFAAAIGALHGASGEVMGNVLRNFKGVPNRLEFVREVGGASYYNDTSCTVPESAMMVMDLFPADKLIVLLGGADKNLDYAVMADKLAKLGVRAYLYGRIADQLRKEIIAAGGQEFILNEEAPVEFADVMAQVARLASEGDFVVLSPATSSFDMFKNYRERGDAFKAIVNNI